MIPENEDGRSFLKKIQSAQENLNADVIHALVNDPYIEHYLTRVEGDMAYWIDSFLEMVDLLLNIIHFQRTGNWDGFLVAIFKCLPHVFSLNRKHYCRNLTYYYLDMIDLRQRNIEAYKYLENGGFTGSLTGAIHTNIPCDQMIESTINRFSKSTGGILGKTEDNSACERWIRLNPYMCALKEHMDLKIHNQKKEIHIELGARRKKKDESDVVSVIETLDAWVPDLYSKDKPLMNISNGVKASEELIENTRSLMERGEKERNSFFSRINTVGDAITDGELQYNDPIKKKPLFTFSDKKKQPKANTIPEDEGLSFGDILARYDKKFLDVQYLCSYPVTSRPWAICRENEKEKVNSKSLFRNRIQKFAPIKPLSERNAPYIHTYVVDAMKIVRMIPITKLKPPTYLSWTKKLLNHIMNLKGKVIHIVFDRYTEEIDLSRPSKGRSLLSERKYVSCLTQILPSTTKDWQSFLSNDANKYQLIKLITEYILSDQFVASVPIYVTKDDQCFRKETDGSLIEIDQLRCTHMEADPRLALHSVFASNRNQNEPVAVVSDDTDVFIILLSITSEMHGDLFFRQGKSTIGKGIEYHNVSSLASYLGEECCRILPGFHALTGSDYTFPFYRRSKYLSFSSMMNLKKVEIGYHHFIC